MLTSLEICGYRSLERVKLPLSPLTVVTGANGTGKSNVIEALATALVHRPAVLLLDEPTSQLDARSRGAALELLREVHDEEHATIVIATHDEDVAEITDAVVRVQDGRLL